MPPLSVSAFRSLIPTPRPSYLPSPRFAGAPSQPGNDDTFWLADTDPERTGISASPSPGDTAVTVMPTAAEQAEHRMDRLIEAIQSDNYRILGQPTVVSGPGGKGRYVQQLIGLKDIEGRWEVYTFERPHSSRADLRFRLIDVLRKEQIALDVARKPGTAKPGGRFADQFGTTYRFRYNQPDVDLRYVERDRPLRKAAANALFRTGKQSESLPYSAGDKAVVMFLDLMAAIASGKNPRKAPPALPGDSDIKSAPYLVDAHPISNASDFFEDDPPGLSPAAGETGEMPSLSEDAFSAP